VERAIRLDRTCECRFLSFLVYLDLYPLKGTGEHGVGIGKKEYLVDELGLGTVPLMGKIKRAIDPLGLFNPGMLSLYIWSA
jgi:hypothetical protein